MLLSIRHYEFSIAEPYQEGDTIGELEANILNRLRIAQIKENWMRRIPAKPLLSAEELRLVRERFEEYDNNYVMTAPSPFRPQWTLEDEARLLRAEGRVGDDLEEVARRRYSARIAGVTSLVGDYL